VLRLCDSVSMVYATWSLPGVDRDTDAELE
jgi:hypothetical protein